MHRRTIYNIESSDSLSLRVLSIGDGITNDVLEEDLQDTARFLVDKTRDTLNTTTASKTA